MTAYRLRWILLVLALICLAAALWWLAAPLVWDIEDGKMRIVPWRFLPTAFLNIFVELDSESSEYAANVAGFLGVLLVAQWMFLRPRRGFRLRLGETARPMRSAVVAAAFLAMMLTVGGIATLLELADLWNSALETEWYVPSASRRRLARVGGRVLRVLAKGNPVRAAPASGPRPHRGKHPRARGGDRRVRVEARQR